MVLRKVNHCCATVVLICFCDKDLLFNVFISSIFELGCHAQSCGSLAIYLMEVLLRA